jgi:hypothetical protein
MKNAALASFFEKGGGRDAWAVLLQHLVFDATKL